MIDYDDPEQLEALKGAAEDTIQKAHALLYLKGTEGWKIVLTAFDDIERRSLEQLGTILPGDEKSILAAHAVWYSVKNAYANVRKAVDSAIADGAQASQFLSEIDRKPEKDWL